MDKKMLDVRKVDARFCTKPSPALMAGGVKVVKFVRLTSRYMLVLWLFLFVSACSDNERKRKSDSTGKLCVESHECLDGFSCKSGRCEADHPVNHNNSVDHNNTSRDGGVPDHDASALGDATSAGNDAAPQPDPDFDPDGTQYTLDEVEYFLHGTFERSEAAFDGILQQTGEQSASINLAGSGRKESFMLGHEWDCHIRLRRVNIVAPTDTPFLMQEGNARAGTVYLLGKRNFVFDNWREITSRTFEAEAGEITFLPEDLADIEPHYALAVAFEPMDAPATVHIAEIEIFGYCAEASTRAAWHSGDWYCATECNQPGIISGEHRRRITCQRGENTAHTPICEERAPKPTDVGGPCQLDCGYQLNFIGYREFTYNNGSGWLHEGSINTPTSRTGPLPHAVAHARTPDEINGKPCSIQTPASEPDRYFTAFSCYETDSNGQNISNSYCAFRCE